MGTWHPHPRHVRPVTPHSVPAGRPLVSGIIQYKFRGRVSAGPWGVAWRMCLRWAPWASGDSVGGGGQSGGPHASRPPWSWLYPDVRWGGLRRWEGVGGSWGGQPQSAAAGGGHRLAFLQLLTLPTNPAAPGADLPGVRTCIQVKTPRLTCRHGSTTGSGTQAGRARGRLAWHRLLGPLTPQMYKPSDPAASLLEVGPGEMIR